ncbi:MAG: hypothetical protein AAF614_12210 [Chloroflexota bacterium]
MERVAFLIEKTNERIRCLLNPETLVLRRVAGVEQQQSIGGQLTGNGLSDNPLLFTGGGSTELELELLFDVSLAGSTITSNDVRDLTRPFWELAENWEGELPTVRFLWGKVWDIAGVVVAVAEKLEFFTPEGAPQRSWLRMKLVRVHDEPMVATTAVSTPIPADAFPDTLDELAADADPDEWEVHELIGGGSPDDPGTGERLDQIAFELYGDAALWRLLAVGNGIDNPFWLSSGDLVRVPPLTLLNP